MAGHKLKIGEKNENYITDQELWMVFNNIFSTNAKKSSSYKYGLIKSLIENLYNVDDKLRLSFDQIFYSFTKIYWNLVVAHDLRQMPKKSTAVENVLLTYKTNLGIPSNFNYDQLQSPLQIEIIKKVKSKGKENVFGALFGDSDGYLYGFSKETEIVEFNQSAYDFIRRNQKVLTALTNYYMAKYLEEINDIPEIYHLIGKVETITKRSSLKQYYQMLVSYDNQCCFYCGKKLNQTTRGKIHVDHFIPWSFVQNDNLWNLVLSCSSCNLSKSNAIPEDRFLENILERNESLSIVQNVFIKHEFENYRPEKITELYKYSVLNGYKEIWIPNYKSRNI